MAWRLREWQMVHSLESDRHAGDTEQQSDKGDSDSPRYPVTIPPDVGWGVGGTDRDRSTSLVTINKQIEEFLTRPRSEKGSPVNKWVATEILRLSSFDVVVAQEELGFRSYTMQTGTKDNGDIIYLPP